MTEIIHNTLEVVEVGVEMISRLKDLASASPRKRARLCLHRSPTDATHEMLIAFHRDSFMPPHRHPANKSESYHVVEGLMTVHLFDDAGTVVRSIQLGTNAPSFLYRLSTNLWHMPTAVSEWLIYHEVYSGPFQKDRDVEFPSWAPAESDHVQVARFRSLLPNPQ